METKSHNRRKQAHIPPTTEESTPYHNSEFSSQQQTETETAEYQEVNLDSTYLSPVPPGNSSINHQDRKGTDY